MEEAGSPQPTAGSREERSASWMSELCQRQDWLAWPEVMGSARTVFWSLRQAGKQANSTWKAYLEHEVST